MQPITLTEKQQQWADILNIVIDVHNKFGRDKDVTINLMIKTLNLSEEQCNKTLEHALLYESVR